MLTSCDIFPTDKRLLHDKQIRGLHQVGRKEINNLRKCIDQNEILDGDARELFFEIDDFVTTQADRAQSPLQYLESLLFGEETWWGRLLIVRCALASLSALPFPLLVYCAYNHLYLYTRKHASTNIAFLILFFVQ